MTQRKFDFKTDLRVELLVPNAGIFVLGQSVLDGTDVLGADTDVATWVDTLADVVEIYINQGMDVRGGILCTPNPTIASIRLRSVEFDPNNNRAVHVGTRIRVSGLQFPDTAPSTWTTIFSGKIANYETTYNYEGINEIRFDAVDLLQDAINTGISAFNTASSPSPITQAINELAQYMPNGVINSVGSGTWAYTPQYAATNTTAGEILNQILDTEIAVAYLKVGTEELYLWDNAFLRLVSANLYGEIGTGAIFSTEHPATYDPKHYCISEIVFGATTDDVANEIIATRLDNGYRLVERNTDSIDLHGRVQLGAEPNVWSNNQLQLWLNRVKTKTDIKRAKSISFRMLDQNANIRADRNIDEWFLNDCTVNFDKGGFTINENYLISRVEHTITPTTWDTTLELWKGL